MKGKGQLMTYYLIGKGGNVPQHPVSSAMETLKEEEEENQEEKTATTIPPSSEEPDFDNTGSSETRLLDNVDNG